MKIKTGIELIAEERARQISVEGWTPQHDDKHKKFELTRAATSYAVAVTSPDIWAVERGLLPGPCHDWPWEKKWWKPHTSPRQNLIKAGALIVAELDRMQRAEAAR